jgi:hypothetical protein
MTNDERSTELWFDRILVATVEDLFFSDETYYGIAQLEITSAEGELPAMLVDFVAFCEDWNERTLHLPEPPDASEFDRFAALIRPQKWSACTNGKHQRIEDAPIFFKANEVTWRLREGS